MSSYDFVMPFVVCQSMGGPYQDDAYVAGYEAGRFDMALALDPPACTETLTMPFHSANLPQLDLIAMRYGLHVEAEDIGDGWARATLKVEPF